MRMRSIEAASADPRSACAQRRDKLSRKNCGRARRAQKRACAKRRQARPRERKPRPCSKRACAKRCQARPRGNICSAAGGARKCACAERCLARPCLRTAAGRAESSEARMRRAVTGASLGSGARVRVRRAVTAALGLVPQTAFAGLRIRMRTTAKGARSREGTAAAVGELYYAHAQIRLRLTRMRRKHFKGGGGGGRASVRLRAADKTPDVECARSLPGPRHHGGAQ